MIEAGVTVGLGTDGVSAAGNLNLMRQMFLVAGMFKDSYMNPTVFDARRALRAATIEGAKTLQWDDQIGSLEIGKKADFILFDLNHIEWSPFYDPLQTLVFSASTSTISETWVDGVPRFRKGKVIGVNEKQLKIDMESPKTAAIIQRTREAAAALEINGTPGLVVGNTVVAGAIGFDELVKLIAEERNKQG